MGEPGVPTGLFKGAMAFRSPCSAGIRRRSVFYRKTRDAQSGELLESLYRRSHGISVEAANRHLVSVADIEVLIHHDFHGPETAPRFVRWVDLEPSDGEEPTTAETTASSVTGHADGRPDNALRVLGRREGLLSTTPSRAHPVRSAAATSRGKLAARRWRPPTCEATAQCWAETAIERNERV